MAADYSMLSGNSEIRKLSLREQMVFWSILVCYLSFFSLLFVTHHNTIVWKTAIIPLFFLAAFLAGRLAVFVKDWAVFLSLIILFDFFRGFIYALTQYFHLPVYHQYVIDLERFVSGGYILPVMFQHWPYFNDPLLNRIAAFFHGSHFLFFLLVGLTLWFFRREMFAKYKTAVLLTLYLGLLGYLLVPTVPPWMAAKLDFIPPIQRIVMAMYNVSIPTFKTAFDINPVAAMPSLHAAMPMICTLIMLRVYGWRASWLIFYTLGIFLAVIYLGEHYLVDILAGVILAFIAYYLVFIKQIRFKGFKFFQENPLISSLIIMVFAQGLGYLTLVLDAIKQI